MAHINMATTQSMVGREILSHESLKSGRRGGEEEVQEEEVEEEDIQSCTFNSVLTLLTFENLSMTLHLTCTKCLLYCLPLSSIYPMD